MLLFSRTLLTIAVTTIKTAIVFHPYRFPPWINAKGNSKGVMKPGIMRLPIRYAPTIAQRTPSVSF
jgi:hypothetical protein